MPPWGAVKGFGDFRNDQGLTEEQLELIVDWEEGGAPEGEEKNLPATPKLAPVPALSHPEGDRDQGRLQTYARVQARWIVAEDNSGRRVVSATAELPDGSIEPLLWLRN